MTQSNILGVYHLSSVAERIDGAAWYPVAYSICDDIAGTYGTEANIVAGALAALSPRNRWERNVRDAENMVKLYAAGGEDAAAKYKPCTFGSGKNKALKILTDDLSDPDAIRATLKGPKLTEFFTCIVNDRPDVCIDGHAYSIWLGDRVTLANVPSIGKKLRATIKSDYATVAADLNLEPRVLQAITWCTWRRLHNVA